MSMQVEYTHRRLAMNQRALNHARTYGTMSVTREYIYLPRQQYIQQPRQNIHSIPPTTSHKTHNTKPNNSSRRGKKKKKRKKERKKKLSTKERGVPKILRVRTRNRVEDSNSTHSPSSQRATIVDHHPQTRSRASLEDRGSTPDLQNGDTAGTNSVVVADRYRERR